MQYRASWAASSVVPALNTLLVAGLGALVGAAYAVAFRAPAQQRGRTNFLIAVLKRARAWSA